ncbi:hypothetical protein CVIRNUC_005222 [Coccomyxa viridis]|uniref:Uncharacterized protein n=1 Tax=Coccomyxa viridis TaxID=1274662 RepID=A0AAV1I7X2_9CHLO|nr:hypothetical protein CVIRNUC_005222 [Coccomyxa viridis]
MGTPGSISFSLGGGGKSSARKPGGNGVGFNLGRKPQKAAPIADIFGGAEASDDEEQLGKQDQSNKRQRLNSSAAAGPAPPSDPEVRKVIEKLADFVAKNGRSFEDVTRQCNPENSPFRFLYYKESPEYKYYEAHLQQAEASKGGSTGPAPPRAPPLPPGAAAPLPGSDAAKKASSEGDSLAAMEAYTRLAAEKEKARPQEEAERREGLLNETSFDRRRQLAVYRKDGKRGHHMQDFIPPEELARLLAQSGSETAQAQAAALEEQQRIQADNVGHRMLQAMGWREGQGLGQGGRGIAAPITAKGGPKAPYEKGGLGAAAKTDVQAGDDDFEVYRKRMMLGYKHRPNPLGNPRKQYDT